MYTNTSDRILLVGAFRNSCLEWTGLLEKSRPVVLNCQRFHPLPEVFHVHCTLNFVDTQGIVSSGDETNSFIPRTSLTVRGVLVAPGSTTKSISCESLGSPCILEANEPVSMYAHPDSSGARITLLNRSCCDIWPRVPDIYA
jgi:hypothetical protein